MNIIYTICAVRLNDSASETRVWTWASSLEMALKYVNENTDYICESGYYNYVVIEEIKEGCVLNHAEHWCKVDYMNEIYTVDRIDDSPCPNIINWSMG